MILLILGEHFGGSRALLLVSGLRLLLVRRRAAAARLIYSYARDGRCRSAWLRAVSPLHRVPDNAILFTAIVGLLATAATTVDVGAVNANALLVSYAVVGIYLSSWRSSWRASSPARGLEPDGGSLGRWGTPVAAAALVYGVSMLVNLCWPRPADAVAGWLPLAAALLILVPGALMAARRR
jgi:amino acid transporter